MNNYCLRLYGKITYKIDNDYIDMASVQIKQFGLTRVVTDWICIKKRHRTFDGFFSYSELMLNDY